MTRRITNRQARQLLIHTYGLSTPPTGPLDLLALIHSLGYVKLDTIRAVVRAHHHILWSRNNNYREPMLWAALAKRELFEHFTHDASLLPMEFYGVWGRQFARMQHRFKTGTRWVRDDDLHEHVLGRITAEGPLSTHAFDTKIKGKKEMWARPPHKRALDYLWYTGELATCHREKFIKFYDLTDRVIPEEHRADELNKTESLNWLCREALNRLSFATKGEIKDFWDAASSAEVADWLNASDTVPVSVQCSDGTFAPCHAVPGIQARLNDLRPPSTRLRILSPFDPLVRDRKRLLRLFGFDFKIEIFVPAAKRKWGYYVHPILEGDKFVGRIDLKADRKQDVLNVLGFWQEHGVSWTDKRRSKLAAELKRLAKFTGVSGVNWAV